MLPLCPRRHGGQRQIRAQSPRPTGCGFLHIVPPAFPRIQAFPVGEGVTRSVTDEGLMAVGTALCEALHCTFPHQALTLRRFFGFASRNRRCSADEEKLRETHCVSYSSPPREALKHAKTARFRAVFCVCSFSGSGRPRRRYNRMPSASCPHRQCARRCRFSHRRRG